MYLFDPLLEIGQNFPHQDVLIIIEFIQVLLGLHLLFPELTSHHLAYINNYSPECPCLDQLLCLSKLDALLPYINMLGLEFIDLLLNVLKLKVPVQDFLLYILKVELALHKEVDGWGFQG